MTIQESLQEKVVPHWSTSELEDVLNPKSGPIDSDERLQRIALTNAIQEQATNGADDVGYTVSAMLQWKNKDTAIALWAGHITKAEEKRGKPYEDAEAVEAGLIERIAQPAFEERDLGKGELVEKCLPIIQTSAITQLRPEIWRDDDEAKSRIKDVIQTHVDRIQWSSRSP